MISLQAIHPHQLNRLLLQIAELPICQGPQSLVLQLMAIPASPYIIQLMVAVPKFWGDMSKFGVYILKQNASWERQPNGFAELLQRHNSCDAKVCPGRLLAATLKTRHTLTHFSSCHFSRNCCLCIKTAVHGR